MEGTLKLKPYCFLASYNYYRGAAVRFSLAEIVKEAEVDSWQISCVFQDGREEIIFDNRVLSRPSHAIETATARLREIGESNVGCPDGLRLGPPPSDETRAKWQRWASGEIAESEITDFIATQDRKWLPDEELDRIEREVCAGVLV